jgi:hypothetical protein
MSKNANIVSKQIINGEPPYTGATVNPLPSQIKAQKIADGWRVVVNEEQPTAGWIVTDFTVVDIDDDSCALVIAHQYDPVAEEAAIKAAKRAANIARLSANDKAFAAEYRDALRKQTGNPHAETDTTIGVDAMSYLFLTKKHGGTMKLDDMAEFYIMDKAMARLTAFSDDGTMQTFPWEVIP